MKILRIGQMVRIVREIWTGDGASVVGQQAIIVCGIDIEDDGIVWFIKTLLGRGPLAATNDDLEPITGVADRIREKEHSV